jgi:hypothetical protein
MPNMSYCRFQNTNNDLRDCEDALSDITISDFQEMDDDEQNALINLLKRCQRITEMDYLESFQEFRSHHQHP